MFFEDETVLDLVERQIQKVDALTETEQRRLLKTFKSARRELNDRLLVVPEGTFTEQSLRITLVQIDGMIQAINSDLKRGLVDASEIMSQRSIKDLSREITKFQTHFLGAATPVNVDSLVAAQETNNFLINKHEASVDAYSASLRSQITSNIVQSMAMRETSERTVARLRSDVGKFFLGEEWKLNRIARTELRGVYNFSKVNGMRQIREDTLPDLQKALMHPMDHRTGADSKQLAAQNPVVDIDKPFVFTFNRKLASGEIRTERREFQFPPDRPNDRAILISFRKEWGQPKSSFTRTR